MHRTKTCFQISMNNYFWPSRSVEFCAPPPATLYSTCDRLEEKHVRHQYFTHTHTYVFTELTQTGNLLGKRFIDFFADLRWGSHHLSHNTFKRTYWMFLNSQTLKESDTYCTWKPHSDTSQKHLAKHLIDKFTQMNE